MNNKKLVKTLKQMFNRGIYTAEQIAEFVDVGLITPSQYKEITGEDYVINHGE